MLALRPEIKVFSRPIEKKGDFVLVAYYVVAQYADGHVEVLRTAYKTVRAATVAGLLKAGEVAQGAVKKASSILALPGHVLKTSFSFIKSFGGRIISTYANDLSFTISQPIRGPSF